MKQEARIVQGVKSSELTGREAVRLQAQHNAIQREIARDRADDGKLGPVERARIERKQDRLNKRIAGAPQSIENTTSTTRPSRNRTMPQSESAQPSVVCR